MEIPKVALFPSPLFRFGGKLLTRSLPGARSKSILLALSYHLMELEIHLYRIDGHSKILSSESGKPDHLTTSLELMADVHSYVDAWTNVDKCLKRALSATSDPALRKISSKRERWFSRMRQARNDLEHLDERVARQSGPSQTPQIMYVPSPNASTTVILGIRVEIRRRANDRLLSLLDELDLWLDSLPNNDLRP